MRSENQGTGVGRKVRANVRTSEATSTENPSSDLVVNSTGGGGGNAGSESINAGLNRDFASLVAEGRSRFSPTEKAVVLARWAMAEYPSDPITLLAMIASPWHYGRRTDKGRPMTNRAWAAHKIAQTRTTAKRAELRKIKRQVANKDNQ